MILSKKYENKYIKYKIKYLKIKNLIQKGGIPNTLPLSLLAIDKSYFGMLVWLHLCNPQGVALFSFVSFPQRVPRPFTGVRVYDMSLTSVEWLRVVCCGLKGTLVQQLSQSVGHHSELHLNRSACHKMMLCIARRIASKQMTVACSKAAKEAAKEAEELYALGQCAAALVPLQQAIYMGHLSSRALMAWLLIDGREGIAMNRGKAFDLAQEGTGLGCHHCQGVMAFCYLHGYKCDRDDVRSLELVHKSSEMGSRYGQLTLGVLYDDGRGGLVQDRNQALALYQQAAAQGLDGAQHCLGSLHLRNRNFPEALRLYQLAAAQGYPMALYRVAECHERGWGITEDMDKAICWYRLAQAAGSKLAENKLKRLGA